MLSCSNSIAGFYPIAAVLLGLLTTTGVNAKDKVTWGQTDTPPIYIVEGPDKDRGRVDQVSMLLQEKLKEYDHEEVQVTFARIVAQIKNGHTWCFANATKKPERESWAYFSLPSDLDMPYRIIVRKEERAKFGRPDELSLEAVLSDRTLRGSIFRGNAYGPAIDALLQQHPPAQFHSDNRQAMKMLLAHRIDYMIWYQPTAFYAAKVLGEEGQVLALPFKEERHPGITRVMCPKTEWGKKVIDDINAVLRTERPTPQYRRLVEAWLDEDSARDVRQLYDTVFLKTE